MDVYWLSFRINEDKAYKNDETNRTTAGDRRKSLKEAVENCAKDQYFWEETTSFLVFESPYSIDTIVSIIKASKFDSQRDLFLIRAMETAIARICGVMYDDEIYRLMTRHPPSYLKSC